ncbi:hypothetical protein BDV30DRAFT_94405 [Aspergillus minisclerotigenes]|uniref:Uncharacterized protein n=1 Tax=Aspergillus minisclerotigenes TaxID=656917 RepID=A0A5N6J8A2_9EURO|nr:hypothetical protein BDV30DRAFT_94405 [Aspergillus minisclerotigenes]
MSQALRFGLYTYTAYLMPLLFMILQFNFTSYYPSVKLSCLFLIFNDPCIIGMWN